MLRDALPSDAADVLRLNHESVQYLSALTADRLNLLAAQSSYFRVFESAGRAQAFLLAFREGSTYDSPNYRWFAARHQRFLYIDRIVIDASMRGQGLGRRFYEDVFSFARAGGVYSVTCEFDVDPPNPVSEQFHKALGFAEVGRHTYGVSNKEVSLQVCPLTVPIAAM